MPRRLNQINYKINKLQKQLDSDPYAIQDRTHREFMVFLAMKKGHQRETASAVKFLARIKREQKEAQERINRKDILSFEEIAKIKEEINDLQNQKYLYYAKSKTI